MYMCVNGCVCVGERVCVCVRLCVCERVCVGAWVRVWVRVRFVGVSLEGACVGARASVCVCGYMYECMSGFLGGSVR